MQPETQNPQQQPGPTYSNVPEYLHLEPIPVSSKPGRAKKIILIAAASLLLLSAAVAAAVWTLSAPERRFNDALSYLMQTSYVTRAYTVSEGSGKVVESRADSDFSDVTQPKTKLTYSFQAPTETFGVAKEKLELKGDIVVHGDDGYTARLAQAPQGFLPKGTLLDKWYKIANPTPQTSSISAAAFDYLKLRKLFNTPNGILPVGNFSDVQRNQLTELMRNLSVYTIKSSQEVELNGTKATKYEVAIDFAKLQQLRDKIKSELKSSNTDYSFSGLNPSLTVWIDNVSGKVLRTNQQLDTLTKTRSSTIAIDYIYPASVAIDSPGDAIEIQ